MQDNLVVATNSLKSSVSSLRRKLSEFKMQTEMFEVELNKLDERCDRTLTQAEIYKAKLQRETSREVRRLEKELENLRKILPGPERKASDNELKVASTMAIFDSLLRHISIDADDFRMASEAFIFPAIYERVVTSGEDAYYLEEVPASMNLLVDRGREYVEWIRKEYYSHLTNPDTWVNALEYIVEWWRNDALPCLYGARDEQWDLDEPLTLQEMMVWRENPAERPLQFSAVFDAFEMYERCKDEVIITSGLKAYEITRFNMDKK